MSFYEWSSALDIHVHDMNDEHKVLIDLMNRLHAQNHEHQPKIALQKTFGDLISWTKKHFEHEEIYMQSIEYPGFSSHKMIHEKLLAQLDQHYQNFCRSDGSLSPELFAFLKMWLNAHIRGIDIKYGEHSLSYKKTA